MSQSSIHDAAHAINNQRIDRFEGPISVGAAAASPTSAVRVSIVMACPAVVKVLHLVAARDVSKSLGPPVPSPVRSSFLVAKRPGVGPLAASGESTHGQFASHATQTSCD